MSVAAVMALFALLGAALFGGVADAQKKKKGAKAKTLRGKTKPIPDATQTAVDTNGDGFVDPTGNGGHFKNGVLASRIRVPRSLDGSKVKDINLQATITHPDVSDLTVLFVGPSGKPIDPFGTAPGGGLPENYPPGTAVDPHFGGLPNIGPTTFDDQATLFINDINSCPNPQSSPPDPADCDPSMGGFPDGGGVEAFSPYAGSFKPADGSTINSLARRLRAGTSFWMIAFDNDPAGTCSTPGCASGNPADTQPDIPDTGSAGWSLRITPKGGKKK